MVGGQGFDIFIVDDLSDVVLENAGEGLDQVQTSVSYALTAESEVEVLYADQTTTAAINLVGNEFDNFVAGNDGVNIIAGGLGLDTLRGEGSGDVFLWSSVAESRRIARTSSSTSIVRKATCSTSPTWTPMRRGGRPKFHLHRYCCVHGPGPDQLVH